MSNQFTLEQAKALSEGNIEKMTVPRYYTEEELLGLKDELASKSFNLLQIQSEFKDVAKKWKDQIKEVKAITDDLTNKIQAKYEDEKRECFVTPDFESMTMLWIDTETGEIHYSRPMTKSERQLTVGSFNHYKMKEANNA